MNTIGYNQFICVLAYSGHINWKKIIIVHKSSLSYLILQGIKQIYSLGVWCCKGKLPNKELSYPTQTIRLMLGHDRVSFFYHDCLIHNGIPTMTFRICIFISLYITKTLPIKLIPKIKYASRKKTYSMVGLRSVLKKVPFHLCLKHMSQHQYGIEYLFKWYL